MNKTGNVLKVAQIPTRSRYPSCFSSGYNPGSYPQETSFRTAWNALCSASPGDLFQNDLNSIYSSKWPRPYLRRTLGPTSQFLKKIQKLKLLFDPKHFYTYSSTSITNLKFTFNPSNVYHCYCLNHIKVHCCCWNHLATNHSLHFFVAVRRVMKSASLKFEVNFWAIINQYTLTL